MAGPTRLYGRPWLERLEDRTLLAAGPIPSTILTAPAAPLLGTDIALTASFTNTGTATGYGPYIDVLLPSEVGNDTNAITFNPGSATYLGAPVVTTVLTFNAAGQAQHPYAQDSSGNFVTVNGPPGGELVVFQLPFGSFTVGQPTATVHFTAHINNKDDLNTPIDTEVEGGFQFGADPLNDPTVDPSICFQNDPTIVPVTTVPVTPVLFTLQKVYLGPEQETATGPNFPHQYEIDASVAPGQTITSFSLTDALPNNMQFVSLDSETANGGTFLSASLPSTTTPGGSLVVNFNQVVGTGGPTDARVIFTFYIPRDDSTGTPVLPLGTGAFAPSTDNASAAGSWNPIDPNDPQNQPVQATAPPNTITDKSIATQKAVQDLTHPGTPVSGDTLSYTVNFQVSDFFAFQAVTVTDTISDGQDFNPALTGFTPTIAYTQQNQVIGTSGFSANNFSFTTNADGTITVTFNVSQQLADLGLSTGGDLLGASIPQPNGTGGSLPSPNPPPPGTTGTIVFHTLIRNTYRVVNTHTGNVVQGDIMSDAVNIAGTVLNFADLSSTGITQKDGSSASLTLPRGVLTKNVYATDGVHPPNPNNPPLLKPSGTVTYEITYTLPASSVDLLQIADFLPLPILPVPASLTFDGATGAAIPAINHYGLGPADTFHILVGAPTPTVSFDTTANSITFDFGSYKDLNNDFSTIDLLFTVQASTTPFADGLFLTNQAHQSESSETGGNASQDAIAQIKIVEPNILLIDKGVVSTDNPKGVFTPATVGPVAFAPPGNPGLAFTPTITTAGLLADPIHSTLAGIDAADLVKFAFVIVNVGSSPFGAFDVEFKDTLPAGFEIPPSGPGLNLQVTNGAGTAFTVTDLGGGLFGNGLELNDPSANMGALGPGVLPDGTVVNDGSNIAVITYDLETTSAVTPLEKLTNTATLTNYANSPGGPTFVPQGLTSSTNVTIAAPAAAKTLLGTSIVTPNNANNQAVIGETVNYSLQVTIPEGVTPAAQIVDTLPAGLAFVQLNSFANSDPANVTFTGSSNPVVTNNGQTVTFALGDITNADTNNAVAETLTFDYEAVVLNVAGNVNGTTLTNSAVFSWTGHDLPAASAPPITVIEPKLQIAKTASPTTGEAGTVVTFTLVVSHTAASATDAQNVVITDSIPAGVTFVNGSLQNTAGVVPTTLGINAGTITATYNTLLLGNSSTLQFQATVNAGLTAGQIITNQATIAWTSLPGTDPGQITPNNPNAFERTGDPNHGGQTNNYQASSSAQVTVTMPVPSKLLLGTSIVSANNSNTQAVIGELVNYRLTLTVPHAITPAAQFVDTLAPGLAFVKFVAFTNSDPANVTLTGDPTNPTVTNSGQTVTFNFGDINNADPQVGQVDMLTIDYEAVVLNVSTNVSGVKLTNSAVFSWMGHTLPPVSAPPVTVIEPKLQVVKAANPNKGEASNTITFTMVISPAATSTADAQNVVLTDPIPVGLTYVAGTLTNPAGVVPTTLLITGNTITATYSTLALGSTSTLRFQATLDPSVTAGQVLTNTATETWTSLPGTDPGQITPNNPNAYERTGDPKHGGQTNNYLAKGSANVTVFSPQPSKQLIGTSIVNANNSNTQAVIGELVNYQLMVTVPQGITPGGKFVDTLPAGLAFVQFQSFTNSNPAAVTLTGDPTKPTITNNGQTITFNFGTITNTDTNSAVPEILTLDYQTVVLNVASNVNGATLTNSAVFSWTGHTLPPVSAPPVTVIEPKLQTVKSVKIGGGGGNPGDPVEYTITIQQDPSSTTDAYDVTFSDPLPQAAGGSSLILGPTFSVNDSAGLVTSSNFQLTGSDASGWTLSTTPTGSFNLPRTPARVITLTIDGTLSSLVSPGEVITNTAATQWTSLPGNPGQISPFNPSSFERTGNPADPGGALNNYNAPAQAPFTVNSADLAVVKTVSNATPNVGDTITFTLTLNDLGPDTATNVTVTDHLPAGFQFVSALPSEGSYDSTSGIWTVGTVTTTTAQTLTITALVISPAAETNVATISHADQFDPDTSNNSSSATVTPQLADLAVAKTVSDPTPNVGAVITFTVTLTNKGPDTATNVTITDVLPGGLQLLSALPSQGAYNSTSGVWTVGTVTIPEVPTLTITAAVVSPAPETNVATISHADQFDPDTSNNSSGATVTPPQADLALTKTVNDPAPLIGDSVTFTVTLTNHGPDTATNVTVSDALPAGLTLISATPSQGSYDNGIWTVGTVSLSAAPILTISALVVSPNPQTNTATISHGDQFDPDLANNSAAAKVTPQQADLALAKTASNTAPKVGDIITFGVTLTNNGPDAATGVQVSDLLPAELALVYAAPSQGSYNSGAGAWEVGTLAAGAQAVLTVQARVLSRAPQTNTAAIDHADQYDPDLGNNQASVTVAPLTQPFVPPTIAGKTGFLGSDMATAAADAVFVNHLYQDLLGRAPDLAGLNFWYGQLLAGVPREVVAQGIAQSPEHYGLEVDRFYQLFLHRAADPLGRQVWVNALLAGEGETAVELGFLTSAEFTAEHPDNTGFVTSLYYAVLGRTPSASEVAYWRQQLQNGASRATVAQGFLTSGEADLRLLDQYYEGYLGRAADPAGEQLWLALLQSGGLTPESLGQAILASDEYFARAA
jgi:uncharacterized repeat protein (TIGR01451 family)/fimbrial isopeptide formation D2 family protein